MLGRGKQPETPPNPPTPGRGLPLPPSPLGFPGAFLFLKRGRPSRKLASRLGAVQFVARFLGVRFFFVLRGRPVGTVPPPKKNAPGRGLEGVTGGSWGEFGWVWRPLLTNFGLLGTLWGPIFWVHIVGFSDQAQNICDGRLFGATILPFGRYPVPSILCWPRRDARSVKKCVDFACHLCGGRNPCKFKKSGHPSRCP